MSGKDRAQLAQNAACPKGCLRSSQQTCPHHLGQMSLLRAQRLHQTTHGSRSDQRMRPCALTACSALFESQPGCARPTRQLHKQAACTQAWHASACDSCAAACNSARAGRDAVRRTTRGCLCATLGSPRVEAAASVAAGVAVLLALAARPSLRLLSPLGILGAHLRSCCSCSPCWWWSAHILGLQSSLGEWKLENA